MTDAFNKWFKRRYPNYTMPGGEWRSFKQKMRACFEAGWIASTVAKKPRRASRLGQS